MSTPNKYVHILFLPALAIFFYVVALTGGFLFGYFFEGPGCFQVWRNFVCGDAAYEAVLTISAIVLIFILSSFIIMWNDWKRKYGRTEGE